MIRSPFEQFELVSIVKLGIGRLDISLTNSSLIELVVIMLTLMLIRIVLINKGRIVPTRWQSVIEMMYKLVLGMLKESVGKNGEKYVGVVLTLFMFILTMNIIGMVPYSYTVTSQLIVTLTLAVGVWVGKLIVGLNKHGIKLLGMFIPEGLPFALVPFFVIIEIIGFIIPMISLSVRLFANMMSGHVLLKVLFGFTWAMCLAGGIMTIVQVIPLTVLLGLLGLETAVALIQAYVFTLLTCIYIGDMEHGGH